ncbi:inner membrane protein [Escherichia coli]|nr:inner membrane protein [Escherichia coli]
MAGNFVPTPWWGMNSVIRNLPYYSLGAWLCATSITCFTEVPLRRHLAEGYVVKGWGVGAWGWVFASVVFLGEVGGGMCMCFDIGPR